MIEAHLFDSWTLVSERESPAFRAAMLVGGMGTTLFLMLSGVSVALSAGSKLRRSGDVAAAAKAVAWRGLEIFGLAFLFRLQAWLLGWSRHAADLLKVDVLNIMGPAIVMAAFLWRLGRSVKERFVILGAATIGAAVLTPAVRTLNLSTLPDPLEAYIVPVDGLSTFVMLPWVALTFAGACAGVLIDAARTSEGERRVIRQLALGGAATMLAALGASYLPSPFPRSDFWTTSPAYLFLRAGLVALAIAASYAWNNRTRASATSEAQNVQTGAQRWSPVLQLGRTSLFIYWIHVELLYGLISLPLHQALTLPQAFLGYVAFCGLMLGCSIGKERLVAVTRARGRTVSPTSAG